MEVSDLKLMPDRVFSFMYCGMGIRARDRLLRERRMYVSKLHTALPSWTCVYVLRFICQNYHTLHSQFSRLHSIFAFYLPLLHIQSSVRYILAVVQMCLTRRTTTASAIVFDCFVLFFPMVMAVVSDPSSLVPMALCRFPIWCILYIACVVVVRVVSNETWIRAEPQANIRLSVDPNIEVQKLA